MLRKTRLSEKVQPSENLGLNILAKTLQLYNYQCQQDSKYFISITLTQQDSRVKNHLRNLMNNEVLCVCLLMAHFLKCR